MNFINKEHEHFFEECSQHYPDRERQAAFYVLGLSSRLIQHINDLVDSDGIFNTEFNWSWMTEHDQQLYLCTKLAAAFSGPVFRKDYRFLPPK